MPAESRQINEMSSEKVAKIYTELEKLGIKIWLDGGWAVDALLGKQTRPHKDLDIAIEHKNVLEFRVYLKSQGFEEVERAEDKKWDFVLSDDEGHEIDVHAFDFDKNGNVIEEKYWNGYEKDSLTGLGIINGIPVQCASLKQLLKTHDITKRSFKESDHQDLAALHEKFKLEN